jgi:NAD(P)-dependent dehydrogenase (short-subunit alcohol dehydrogenase family)
MGSLSATRSFRTALVTGASAGLGLAFARMLRDEGMQVWGASRNPEASAKVEGWRPVVLDLREVGSLHAAIEQVRGEAGVPDILVNNAGAGVFAGFAHFPPDEISRQLQLLLEGPIALTRAFWPAMLARNSGAVVNVASLAADFPLPGLSLYTAAKAGLAGFTRTLMIESAGSGVQVLDFQPGDYKTDFNKSVVRAAGGEAWEARAWARFEELLEHGPAPARAAEDLRCALRSGRSGTFATGDWFQTRAAMFAQWLGGRALMRRMIRKYYRI